MAYTARIPKHLIFNGSQSPHKTSTNASWDRLPTTNPNQKDARRFMEKGYEWYYWTASTQKEVDSRKGDKHCYVHENKPVKLKLVGWESDFMQAALPSGHLIELPLDILYNAIRSGGFEKDNKTLKGEFIFAMANRKLIPIKVGSGLHKAILDVEKLKNRPKIKVEKLVVGHAYSTPANNVALFLGYVNTETMVVDLPRGVSRWANVHGQQPSPNDPVKDFTVRFLKKKLASLWYETKLTNWQGRKYTAEELLKNIQSGLATGQAIYRFRCKKSHRYVTKVPKFYVNLPTDIVMQVRNAYEKKAREHIHESRLRRGSGADYFTPISQLKGPIDKLRHFDALRVDGLAAECNMTLYGMGIIRSDVFKQFEPWEKK